MNTPYERALKRMLANGPLTAIPKRPGDQDLLATLAAARFDAEKTYREADVNEILKAWLSTFCEPYGIDHVTLRRMLVDARLLVRTTSGSTYRVNRARMARAEDLAEVDLAKMLADVRAQRDARKKQHAA